MRTVELASVQIAGARAAEAATRLPGSRPPDARLDAVVAENLRLLAAEVAGDDAIKAEQLNEFLTTRLSFMLHEESGRMFVRVIDNETNEVIRQIPPESLLEVFAEVREMIGLILDRKV